MSRRTLIPRRVTVMSSLFSWSTTIPKSPGPGHAGGYGEPETAAGAESALIEDSLQLALGVGGDGQHGMVSRCLLLWTEGMVVIARDGGD